MKTLRLLLGDQLNSQHTWFNEVNNQVVYALFEMRQETDYAKHHIQKVVGFFAAMRAFKDQLVQAGHQVVYYTISDQRNLHNLSGNLSQCIKELVIERFEYQLPDEYRLDEQLKAFTQTLSIPSAAVDSEHFLSSRTEVKQLFEGKKQVLMETFYRQMRKRYQVLMDGDAPVGGKWNYDAENRNKWKGTPAAPTITVSKTDVTSLVEEIRKAGVICIGEIRAAAFHWPITREQALQQVEVFVTKSLPFFGQFQDAMSNKEPFLFHSLLSFALNTKLISPLEVVQRAVEEWKAKPSTITLPQIEGFVRQIIGWREYMRGIYWWKMPEFAQLNYFNHQTKLPHYFWDANTKMNCVKEAVSASLQHAYAHHIQRLMVTGNFALLAGIHPDEVDAWYLGIYMDAIEWVEITNTRGMSQYADGGIVGSKPYVSSANYMDKMSDYCSGCSYDKKAKVGAKACPFNSLYWHFFERNRTLLQNNQRLGMMYNVWNKMPADERAALVQQAEHYLARLEEL